MKKTFAFILVLSMALALCACGGEGTGEVIYVDPTPAAETAAPAVETPASTADTAASTESADALGVVLDYAVNDVQPGSSGCSLRGIKCAAMLLDWAAETPLDADGIAAAVETWKSAATEDALSLFSECMDLVASSCESLSQDNAQELLDESGSTDCAYPWNDAAFAAAQSVFSAAGVR